MELSKKRLTSQFETQLTAVGNQLRQFPWEDRRAYGMWLAQTYYFVQHTTSFLALTAGKFGTRYPRSHREALSHLREESGHDALAIRDICAVGGDITKIPELMETKLFWELQYYWIDRCGPVAHAGYSLLLEGVAAAQGKWLLQTMEKYHGKNAVSFIRTHAHEDTGHFAQGMKRLAAAPSRDVGFAVENLRQSAFLYSAMIQAVVARSFEARPIRKIA